MSHGFRVALDPSPAMSRRPRLAISLGDPCGIGPELLVRTLARIQAWADPVVIGPRAGLDLLDGTAGQPVAWRWAPASSPVPAGFAGAAHDLEVLTPGLNAPTVLWLDPTPWITAGQLALGKGSATSGEATVQAIRYAAGLAQSGWVDALVTLPMAKAAAHLAGYDLPGHTEFLQALAGVPITRMAFVSPTLAVVLHTVHQSLKSVVEGLESESLAETLSFAATQFIELTGRPDLRVALCALNPHAGEDGAFGDEETILREALALAEASFMRFDDAAEAAAAQDRPAGFKPGPEESLGRLHTLETPPSGLEVASNRGEASRPVRHAPRFFGPLPSDSLFHRAAQGEFDLVVALYHDQGLIPIKVLEPERAVNLTLGLPYVRTSPDHGTAFDKAGKWLAHPVNFLEAAALAVRLAGRAKGEAWPAEVGAALDRPDR